MASHSYSKPQEKTDILNRFFASVFTQGDSSPPVMNNDPTPDIPPFHIWKGFTPPFMSKDI